MKQFHDTKRIAKNSLVMYFRMFVMMLIGLYTSRVVLNTLGVEDFGIYNVVGGVVAMFSIISSSMSSSVTRFLTFEIGKDNVSRLKEIFSTSIIVQLIMAFSIFIVMEIIGVWFLQYKMNIPNGRLDAACFVMQCSIASFALGLINIPFNALIIAHERFKVFAYLTLSDSILKLIVVYLLYISRFDKLKTYALLILTVTFLVQMVYFLYCRKQFLECRFTWKFKKNLFKEIAGFAGWTFIGNGSYVLMTQGVNILMNVFFGVAVNAARGVVTIVENILNQFVNNFITAVNPQITKSYASGDTNYMINLINGGSKFSYLLLFAIALPVFVEAEQILKLWIVNVPPFSVTFLRLMIINMLVTVLSNTMVTGLLAIGQIKNYQITIGVISLMVLPFSYFFYKMGAPVYISYLIQIVVMLYELIVRLLFLKKYLNFNIEVYIKDVVMKLLLTTFVSGIFAFLLTTIMKSSPFFVILKMFLLVALSILVSYVFALNKQEQQIVKKFIERKVHYDRN